MLRINKDKGEIVFSYDNSEGVPVQGRITYMVLDNKRVTFTLMAQTAKLNYEVRDIGMLLAAIGTDLMLEGEKSEQSEGDGYITATEARRRTLNGE
jgi:hypothetical protein